MKSNNLLFVILVTLIISLIIYIIYSNRKFKEALDIRSLDVTNNEYSQMQFMLEDSPIDPEIKLVTPFQDTIDLYSLVSDSPKLFLIYSRNSCTPCTDIILTKLDQLSSKKAIENVQIITDFHEIHELLIFTRLNKIKFDIYTVSPYHQSNLFINGQPFFTVIDTCLIKKCVFLPITGDTIQLNTYLNTIEKRLKMFN